MMATSLGFKATRRGLSRLRALAISNLVPSAGTTRNVLNLAEALSEWADVTVAFRRIRDAHPPGKYRTVAIEPQPALARTLRLLLGRDRAVTIEEVAVGRAAGTVELKLNLDNPTVATASDTFIKAAEGMPGWAEQRWTGTLSVPVISCNGLSGRRADLQLQCHGSA